MTLSETARQIVSAVAVASTGGGPQDESQVQLLATNMRIAFAASGRSISDEEFSIAIKTIHARLAITMDTGTALVEHDHVPWLAARRPVISPFYWGRFSDYLVQTGWSPPVLGTLDTVTDDILDLLGNPAELERWNRRGLVIGDVQSGKTATYTALCCKAADAGYRVIILLTGTLENLRRQTQKRLDEGFVGLDSSDILTKETGHMKKVVGAGELNQERFAGVFTSRTKDFNKPLLSSLGFTLKTFSEPVLVVIKKNRGILNNLRNWLRAYNADPHSGLIDEPMLLIDDEADNASVNTAALGKNPTSINEGIRGLLSLFRRASYIGFTATPFANIFIDPKNESEMLGHDLFPRDFIYALQPPTNYIGATRIFNDDNSEDKFICHIEDAESAFPSNHKSYFQIEFLPQSLKRAIRQYFLANVVRDLRGHENTHRSMLVNVSRFTDVQNQLAKLIETDVRGMQQDVRSYSQLDPTKALLNDTLASLKSIYEEDFQDIEFEWNAIQKALHASVLPIDVRSVNRSTGAASLDYAAYSTTGFRVIAVGGMSLSRGLTLEGLCISYFYRNSQMYDTLLQMGRWFGYRDEYSDLCRLWLTEDAQQWYSHITLSSEELRDEVQRMKRLSLTPKEFGLKVRSHPDSLIVTARNKMRLAKTIVQHISFSGEGPETTRLKGERSAISANALAARELIHNLDSLKIVRSPSPWGNLFWANAPKEVVAEFLNRFESHPHNFSFYTPEEERQSHGLARFIRNTDEPKLQSWDIVIPNGQENPINLFDTDIEIRPSKRGIIRKDGGNTIMVSGTKARVGSRGVEKEGLHESVANTAREKYLKENPEKKGVPDKVYRAIRPKPLLLLYVVKPYEKDKDVSSNVTPDGTPLIAIGLSFPEFDDSDIAKKVSYNVNLVEWQNKFNAEIDEDLGEDDDGND